MKTLPLTILYVEGPQARAYLSRLALSGYQPQELVVLIFSHDQKTKKPLLPWLPKILKVKYLGAQQKYAYNFWPKEIKNRNPLLVKIIAEQVERVCEPASLMINEMTGEFFYERYAPKVKKIFVSGINDARVSEALKETMSPAVLFTGGGILKENILNSSGKRFIHVHPGYLPFVRGADGLLWSVLKRQRIGLSAFYMDASIDTGEIIARQEMDPLSCDLSGLKSRPDDQTLYRAVFSFMDPILRAEFLLKHVIEKGEDYSRLPTFKQSLLEGETFRFMSPEIRHKALSILF